MSRLGSLLANTGLMVAVVGVLGLPLIASQFLASYQSGALGEATSQLGSDAQSTALFAVQTNAEQFTPYVEFDPQPLISANMYQTSVTFTSFKQQQAAYNGLLTITNTTANPLVVRVEAGKASGVLDHSQIWLNLQDSQRLASTLTTQTAAAQSKVLTVAQTTGFNSGTIVVQGQTIQATATNSTTLSLSQPLTESVGVGQKVYFGAAYFGQQATPTLAAVQPISLAPGQQATLNLVVATEDSPLDTNQLVVPLTISAQ